MFLLAIVYFPSRDGFFSNWVFFKLLFFYFKCFSSLIEIYLTYSTVHSIMTSLHILWNDCHSKFSHHPSSYTNKKEREIKKIFFMMRTLRSYTLNNFSIIQQFYLLSSCYYFQYLFCNQKFVPVNNFVSGFFRNKIYIWLYLYLASSSRMLKLIHVIAWISSLLKKNYIEECYGCTAFFVCLFLCFKFTHLLIEFILLSPSTECKWLYSMVLIKEKHV